VTFFKDKTIFELFNNKKDVINIKKTVIITEKINQNFELLYCIKERSHLTLIERNKSLYSPCDFIFSENYCSLLLNGEDLIENYDNEIFFLNLFENLIYLSLQFSNCLILVYISKE
jgi:hypothetical protein